jgi:hypothetical protein
MDAEEKISSKNIDYLEFVGFVLVIGEVAPVNITF